MPACLHACMPVMIEAMTSFWYVFTGSDRAFYMTIDQQ